VRPCNALRHALLHADAATPCFTVTAEFHTTNMNSLRALSRLQQPPQVPHGLPYKALVYVYLNGGMDSYNMIVPHSDCGALGDMYATYAQVRGGVALSKASLLQIDASSSLQPCNTFGLVTPSPIGHCP
jgi:uncharacterized protein (DUF1501 family)